MGLTFFKGFELCVPVLKMAYNDMIMGFLGIQY